MKSIKKDSPLVTPRGTPNIKSSPKPPPKNDGHTIEEEKIEDLKPPPRERGFPRTKSETEEKIQPEVQPEIEPKDEPIIEEYLEQTVRKDKPERAAPEPPQDENLEEIANGNDIL